MVVFSEEFSVLGLQDYIQISIIEVCGNSLKLNQFPLGISIVDCYLAHNPIPNLQIVNVY